MCDLKKHPRHLPGLQMVLLHQGVESSLTTQRISGRWKGVMELRSSWRCARQSELTVVTACNFFLLLSLPNCAGGKVCFVASLLPTLKGGGGGVGCGRTPKLQNGGRKSWPRVKTAPKKPFGGPALTFLDAVFLLKCFRFAFSFFALSTKKAWSRLKRQPEATTPVLETKWNSAGRASAPYREGLERRGGERRPVWPRGPERRRCPERAAAVARASGGGGARLAGTRGAGWRREERGSAGAERQCRRSSLRHPAPLPGTAGQASPLGSPPETPGRRRRGCRPGGGGALGRGAGGRRPRERRSYPLHFCSRGMEIARRWPGPRRSRWRRGGSRSSCPRSPCPGRRSAARGRRAGGCCWCTAPRCAPSPGSAPRPSSGAAAPRGPARGPPPTLCGRAGSVCSSSP